METLQAHGRGEKTELGSQRTGSGCFPRRARPLTQNMSWTTQLGNAFLAQQADVMQAVQRMRAQAQAKGTLHSTPQETVTTQNQGGQSEISIEPANPDIWYVPNYNPAYVWGPPVWGFYPPLFTRESMSVSGGIPASISVSISAAGAAGAGAAGDGVRTGSAGISSSTIPSFTATVSGFPMEDRWAVPCGRIIRNTGSACRMPIARWPTGLAHGARRRGSGSLRLRRL